jgi:hypothetical protein
MIIAQHPDARRLGEAIQAQVKEGGFDLELVPTEFAASLDQTDAGKYQMFQIGWSGRVDPDGNIANFVRTRVRRTTAATPTPLWTRCSTERADPTDQPRARPVRPGDHQAARGRAADLPVPAEEPHRRLAQGRRRQMYGDG